MADIVYGGPGIDDGMGGASLPKAIFPKDRNVPIEQVAAELVVAVEFSRGYGTSEITLSGPFLTAHVQFTDAMPVGGGYDSGSVYLETYDEVEVIGIDRANNKVQIRYNIVSVSRTAEVRARRQLPPEAYSVDGL